MAGKLPLREALAAIKRANEALGLVPIADLPRRDEMRRALDTMVREGMAVMRVHVSEGGTPAITTIADVFREADARHAAIVDARPPAILPDDCWTVGIGAVPHKLGSLPDDCYTCAAKRRQDDKGT